MKREVAQAVVDELVPRADVLTPNLWELGFIAGRALEDEVAVLAAARGLAPRVLVTSAPAGADRTGVLDVTPHAAWRLSHGRFATAPNGTGDLLAALAVAAILDGETSPNDARRAAAGVVDALDGALALGADNLPLARRGGDLRRPRAPVMIEAL